MPREAIGAMLMTSTGPARLGTSTVSSPMSRCRPTGTDPESDDAATSRGVVPLCLLGR